MQTLGLYTLKDIVGKSAATANLALIAPATGSRSLLWAHDAHGVASWNLAPKGFIRRLSARPGGTAVVHRVCG